MGDPAADLDPLQTRWFQAQTILVGFNTLVLAILAVGELLPPRRWPRLLPSRR